MSTIASKNLYDLLGNDPDQDPDRAPDPPVKVIDKPVARTGKRNAGPEAPAKEGLRGSAPAAAAGGRGGRSEGAGRGDQANGRPERRDDGRERRPRGDGQYRGEGRGRGRGGRGRGDRPPRDDRHSHTGIGEQQKQAAQGWGGESGNAEWADEKAGDAIANAEAKNDPNAAADTDGRDPAFTTGPDGETGADAAEEEDKTKSYEQYLAEQKEKRAALGAGIEIRKPNEGSKQKFPEGKAFARDPADEDFMAGAGGKTRKAKDAGPKKEQIVVDGQYYAAADSGDRGARGGRGGSRGGPRGGRGEFRGDRGGRGRGRGGDFRGGARGGADRGPAARGSGFNATDESAFPALGGN